MGKEKCGYEGWSEGSRTVSSNIVQTTVLWNSGGVAGDWRYGEILLERLFAREPRYNSVISISINELDIRIDDKFHLR